MLILIETKICPLRIHIVSIVNGFVGPDPDWVKTLDLDHDPYPSQLDQQKIMWIRITLPYTLKNVSHKFPQYKFPN
jgi:hypothetical protein